MKKIEEILREYWGYETFRPLQKEIIQSVLEGKDTLALLPTGGGKSICYQVPALAQDGITLVISPLIALMKDQVENLKKKGVLAAAIYSGMSKNAIVQTLKNVAYGPYKLLYVSPERLETDLFKEYLPALNINFIAVDEAHCISQWGYDFRPSYLRIAALREELPDVPVLALTASATSLVQKDICERLLFRTENIFRQSFKRENLSYSVFKVDAKLTKLVDIISKVQGSAIVYCKSRKRTVEIANLLQMHGINASYYHAGLTAEDRAAKQENWISDKVRVMACTNAFGMGIDKPDVRLVIHADCTDCLENYYQEAGRAGRDGKRSYAVLLYDEEDISELKTLHQKRYPSFEQVKEVYTALVNFLQIPNYSGEDVAYTFRFDEFIRNFKLDGVIALASLKTLEADGWFDFNEKNYFPSQLMFTTTKSTLYEFEEGHPEYEPLLTTLLRTYEGIFDFPASISENLLARLLRKEEGGIKKQLKEVAAFRVISYTERNDQPQIIFRRHRVAVNDFRIDLKKHQQRKDLFIERVKNMVAYTSIGSCRSQYINHYFGDTADTACGICDNCLRKKSLAVSQEEFEKINALIHQQLATKQLSAKQLVEQLPVKKEKSWNVIEFLQAEKKLMVNDKGLLELSK
jgi:ATP-dependent DNA helicase RecQ